MSDDSKLGNMPSISEVNSQLETDDILTINIFKNDDDVDVIKAKLNGVCITPNSTTDESTQGPHNSNIEETSDGSVVDNEKSQKQNSHCSHQDLEQSSEPSELLCLSTETLIDNHDSLPCTENSENDQRKRNLSGPSKESPVGLNVNSLVTMATTNVTSGLLISPTSLSQDVHIQMGEANKRMSTVLESLDLQLVYIPTTRQLVAEKISHGSSGNTGIVNSEDKSSIVPNTEQETEMSDSSSCQLSSSPTKMLRSKSNSLPGVTILTPRHVDDSSSICETECLIRGRDPDAMSCDCSEFVCNFPRINTNESLLRTFTDASSLSSISTGTDFSVSAASLDEGEGTGHCIDTGDGGFMEINLHSRNSFERTKNPSQDSGFEDKLNKPKRKGLSGFLSRNIFSRRSKDSSDSEDGGPGWKLFGKIPPKQAPDKHHQQIKMEYEPECPTLQQKRREELQTANRAKKEDIEVLSTTALILENRPMNLPTKDPEERDRHQREYQSMVEAAKRKELKELKRKKKQMQQQLRQEEQLMAAAQTWTRDILPNWETMKTLKKTRDLWWQGIPTNVRGKVWKLALGNDLNITPELYEICVSRAADKIKQMDEAPKFVNSPNSSPEPASSKESSVELIKLDVSRTFPQLCIFQKGGPYHDLLHSLLGAYACYRPDVGYVQGMSFIAAVLLLNMEVADAFICFANLLNRPCQVAFFRIDEGLMKCYFKVYEEFFKENMPTLQQHFKKLTLSPDIYLYDWIFTLFSRPLPLDIACRVWDIYCRDGEEFLFKTALGILKCHETVLINMDFIHTAQFLTRLPDCDNYENMFKCIDTIQMSIDKKNFTQVLANKINLKDNT